MNRPPILNLIALEIGRGHPFYLDGVREALLKYHAGRLELRPVDIRDMSRRLPAGLWQLVDFLYRWGSRGGKITSIYSAFRKKRNPNQYGPIEHLLAADLRRLLAPSPGPALVSHPLLVPMLADRCPVFYQHGEIAAPHEAAVTGATKIFVPLPYTQAKLLKYGVMPEQVAVTGLCIEPPLAKIAVGCFHNRLERLRCDHKPVGAFFSSGAEPPDHVRKIILALEAVRIANMKAVVFARHGGRLDRAVLKRVPCQNINSEMLASGRIIPPAKTGITLAEFSTREEENTLTLHFFDTFDYFVAPAHERSNWAVGLGLPIFILHPMIGSFASENCRFLHDSQVACDIRDYDSAVHFASQLDSLKKSGRLVAMAENGFGRYEIDGFKVISDYLATMLLNTEP